MASGMGEYGVEVQNRFNLSIDDDVDPYEILKKQEEGRGKAKKDEKPPVKGQSSAKGDKQQPSAAKKPVAKPSSASAGESIGRVQQNGSSRGAETAPKTNVDTRSAARPPRQQRSDRPVNFEEVKFGEERPPPRRQFEEGGFPGNNEYRGRGGGRGFGRGRGGGGRGAFNRSEKREYDRHSGSDRTGVKPVDKKEGAGSHNWGTVEDDLPEGAAVTTEAPETSPPEDTENQDPNAEQPTVAPQDEVAEPHEMTLDEWKEQQNKLRVKAEFNTRKPNEGVDNKQWKNTYMLAKRKESDEEQSEESAEEEEEEVEDTKAALNKLNIKITFNDSDRGFPARRRGRGGRGGERGYDGFRGRGGYSHDNAERPGFTDGAAERPVRDRPYNNERGGFGERFSGRRSYGASDEPQGDQDQERVGFGGEGGFARGGFRGRGGFNRPTRGTPKKEEVIRVDDENDFPALGKGK